MIILGIDYGKKRVGLAIAESPLARPLSIWTNEKDLVEKLTCFCREQKIEKIVIGLPEGSLRQEIASFGQKLAKLSSLPMEFESECLTTKEAIDRMIAVGKRQKYRQEKEDAFAAALILQNFLDKQKNV